jgi:hypothetical protein
VRLWAVFAGTAATAVLVVALAVVLGTTDRDVSGFRSVENRPIFPNLTSRLEQVRTVEIKSSDRPLVFKKTDDEWRFPRHYEHLVQTTKVEKLLQTLVSLHADYMSNDAAGIKGSGMTSLGEPFSQAVGVRLLSEHDELLAGAIIGHEVTLPRNTDPDRMLVRREHGKRAWLATPTVRIEANPRAWLQRDVVDIPGQRVKRLLIVSSEGGRVTLRRSEERGVYVTAGLRGDNLAGEPMLEASAAALENLQFEDVRPVQAISSNSSMQGYTVIATSEGLEFTIQWLVHEEQVWSTIRAGETKSKETGNTALVAERFNARHAKWAYKLPAHAVRYLRLSATELSNAQRASPDDVSVDGGKDQ